MFNPGPSQKSDGPGFTRTQRRTSMPDHDNLAIINTYSALSGCYLPPDENLAGLVSQLEENLGSWVPQGQEPLKSMIADLNGQSSGLTEMSLDYTRLFLGPFGVLAPPFGSVYLNAGKKMVMDETTEEVARMYLRAGLDVDRQFNNPADHITAELEFMHYLHYQEQAALNDSHDHKAHEFKSLRQEFFRKHIGKWGPTFAHKVEENAQLNFYRQLGLLTRLVLAADGRSE